MTAPNRNTLTGEHAFARDRFNALAEQVQQWTTQKLRDNLDPDDVSGALTVAAVALLCALEGRKATAKHLNDIAARLKV